MKQFNKNSFISTINSTKISKQYIKTSYLTFPYQTIQITLASQFLRTNHLTFSFADNFASPWRIVAVNSFFARSSVASVKRISSQTKSQPEHPQPQPDPREPKLLPVSRLMTINNISKSLTYLLIEEINSQFDSNHS